MGEALRYEILGPLRLPQSNGYQLRAGKPRQLLATLLLHPNRFVSIDLIADALWEGSPPRSATANIRTHVRSLRSALVQAGLDTAIDTSAAGYSIEVGVDQLDASLFESLLAEAGHLRTAGETQQAMTVYTRAHGLWRGRPLEDLTIASAWAGSVSRLEAQHRTLVDALLELRLRHGDPAGAVLLLNDRLAEDPYDEGLWSQLVDALLTAGRISEARAAYERATHTLADELDVQPGPDLRRAGARVRSRQPRRTTEVGATASAPAVRRVPSQLPLDLADFSGRVRELDRLRALVAGRDPIRPPIAVISGAPGTGKTSLAVRLGHLVRESFPDGQIYLDLRGATQPRDSSGALHDLLRSLDIPDSAVPPDQDRRSAALRSELASRRVLIILDDAGSARQVLPLLPGTGASALVITSRSRMTDLAGAECLPLDTLDDRDAGELLRKVAGPDRLAADGESTEEILAACGNLPLAIRIAASRLARRADLTPAELARRLRDESQRLDELSIGELAVRTSADLSYRALRPDDARLYRLIGHLAVGDFSARSLEPVAGARGLRGLDRLIEANLVQIRSLDGAGQARYWVHDLVRLHASQVGDPAERAQAVQDLTTVLDAALGQARRAAAAVPMQYFGVPEQAGPPDGPLPTAAQAIAWFDTERSTFVPTVRAASHNGLHEHAWRIAAAWAPYLDMHAVFDDWAESHLAGLVSAQACGDRRAEGIMRRNLGQVGLYRDDWEPARRDLDAAYGLFEAIGDRLGIGVACTGLGTWYRERGEPDRGLALYEQAKRAFVEVGDANGESVARSAISAIWVQRGELDAAAEHLAIAFRLGVRGGDPHREAKVRRRIAELRERQDQHDQAVRQFRTALDIFVSIGDEHCASYTQAALGQALLAQGEEAAARRMFLAALEAGQRLGDRSVEAQAAARLGELHRLAGHTDSARRYLQRAARVWKLVANESRAEEAEQQLSELK